MDEGDRRGGEGDGEGGGGGGEAQGEGGGSSGGEGQRALAVCDILHTFRARRVRI